MGALMSGCVAVVVALARAPVSAANEFVARLDDGEIGLAYASLCLETRSVVSREEFADHVSAAPRITGYLLTSTSSPMGDATTVSGTIRIGDVPRNVTFRLVQENGEWRVCRYDRLADQAESSNSS
jgi:hypothetical protein